MQPRIYTYKITFADSDYFYFGVHKEREFDEEYWGSPVTHREKWDLLVPRKEILNTFLTWEEARKAEIELIRPFLNDPLCLNENCGGFYSLEVTRESGRKGGLKTASIPGHMTKAAKASGRVWTDKKREACRKNADKAREIQKKKRLQIYGDWEYFRRKGRLTHYGVLIDGIRVSADELSETFKEYHLLYGVQRGGYQNPKK